MKFDILMDLLKSNGYEPSGYSGRGMYGAECVGVVTGDPWKLVSDLIYEANVDSDAIEALAELLRYTRSDDMGRSTILYWPTVEWEGGDELPDEDDDGETWDEHPEDADNQVMDSFDPPDRDGLGY